MRVELGVTVAVAFGIVLVLEGTLYVLLSTRFEELVALLQAVGPDGLRRLGYAALVVGLLWLVWVWWAWLVPAGTAGTVG